MKTLHRQPLILDLYSGAGGLSLGAVRAGFKVWGAVDNNSYAINVHKYNFPSTSHFQLDLFTSSFSEVLTGINVSKIKLDGIIGGPPCQGFSTIGKRDINDSRNNLFVKFFQIVSELKPSFFLAENVLGILSPFYDDLRNRAFEYIKNDYIILDKIIVKANEYGAPTTRTRVFFIGYNKNCMDSFHENDFLSGKVNEQGIVKVKDALLGLPVNIDPNISMSDIQIVNLCSKPNTFYESRIFDGYNNYAGNVEAIDNYKNYGYVTGCSPTKHSSDVKERYANLKYNEMDSISKSVRLNPDGFCPTLRAGTGPEKGSFQAVRPIHFSQPRVITPREAARLQGFPDWFVFDKTKWHSFRLIGNSVSPIVAEKLLSVIYQKLT